MILDTNALSAFADGDDALLAKLDTALELCVPVIVLGEYRFGIRQSRYRRSYEKWLDDALRDMAVLPILDSTAEHYAGICQELMKGGTPIPSNDVWIAALCREHGLPIVSRDQHFGAVTGLRLVSW